MPSKPPQTVKMNDFESRYRKWHTTCSYVKSGIRLVSAGAAMWFYSEASVAVLLLAIGFAAAEIVGILEELI